MGKGNKARTVLQRLITCIITRVRLLSEALCMFLHQYITLCHCLLCHCTDEGAAGDYSESHLEVPKLRYVQQDVVGSGHSL